jgi:4-hydroxybenzoate polyprenyltransferase
MDVLAETLWGRRGIVKANHIWLTLAVLASLMSPYSRYPVWKGCLLFFMAAACFAQASILANDLSDQERDVASGKRRWIFRVPRWAGIAIVAAIAGAGAFFILLAGGTSAAVLAYLAAIVLGVLYSLRPFRLKERGLLGLVCYSAAATFAYAVLPWTWRPADPLILVMIAPAVFLDKWTNLQFHQIIDLNADKQDGTATHAARRGRRAARRSLRTVSLLTSIWLLLTFAAVTLFLPPWRVPFAVFAAMAFSAVGLREVLKKQPESTRSASLVGELPLAYLALTFVLFRLAPLMILGRTAFDLPDTWPAFGLCLVTVAIESWHSYNYRYE